MSANNYVSVEKRGGVWLVNDNNADGGHGFTVKEYKTRDEAIDEAVKYCQENFVEYGIAHIDPLQPNKETEKGD